MSFVQNQFPKTIKITAALVFLLAFLIQSAKLGYAADCAFCTDMASDCTDAGLDYRSSDVECKNAERPVCCLSATPTPTPTPTSTITPTTTPTPTTDPNCAFVCVIASSCETTASGTCGMSGFVCCQKAKDDDEDDEVDTTKPWGAGLVAGKNSAGLPGGDIHNVLGSALVLILEIFILLGVLFFILTGMKYLFGGIDSSAKSKLGFTHLFLGLLVGLGGYILVKFIDDLLNNNL